MTNNNEILDLQKSLGETIADLIKKSIWTQEYDLGERLLEKKQAEKFNVSRTTIREAFSSLENQGLIINKARKGTYVAHFTKRDLKELIELRILIEQDAALKALFSLDENDFKMLSDILEEMKTHIKKVNWYELFNLDLEFHNTIVNLCGNSRIVHIFELNQTQMRTYIGYLANYYTSPEEFYEEHLKLFHLLKTKNACAVAKGINEHIIYAEEKLLGNITKN